MTSPPRAGPAIQSFFKAWSATYDTAFYQEGLYRPLHQILEKRVAQLTAAGPVGLALDVGMGTGQSLTWLPQYAGQVVGLDYSSDMLRQAVQRQTAGTHLLRGSATALPFPSASVEVCISCFSMHWWPDVTAGWAEMGRVLKPGRCGLVLVPSSALLALPAVKQALGRALVHWLPPKEYVRMAKSAGLLTRLPRQVYPTAWLLEVTAP